MDRALEVDQAKRRLREAADRLGEETAFTLLRWSPRATLRTVAVAAVVGLVLGRNGRLFRVIRDILPGLLRATARAERDVASASHP